MFLTIFSSSNSFYSLLHGCSSKRRRSMSASPAGVQTRQNGEKDLKVRKLYAMHVDFDGRRKYASQNLALRLTFCPY